jgi:purine-binding chemotaxis protein CheW
MTRDPSWVSDRLALRIDWSEVHRRLERAQAALEQRTTLTPDETNAILKARAKALAREQEPDQCEQDRLEVIEFVLADEKYAVESSFVREVYPFREFTPIPGAPPFVLGVTNVRGQIVSVVDLKKFFGLPEKGLPDLRKVILISDGEMEFGLLADTVVGLRHILLPDLQATLPTLTGARKEFLKGVTAARVAVLDSARLLSDERMLVDQKNEPMSLYPE